MAEAKQIRVSSVSLADLEGVLSVIAASFSEETGFWGITRKQAQKMLFYYRIASVLQKLTGPRFKFFVAKLGDEVVGTTMVERRRNYAYLEAVAVHPRHRRKGYARALVAHAIKEAFSWGLDRVVLRVREDNFPAKNLYCSLGFEPFERIVTLVWEGESPGLPVSLPSGYRLVRARRNDPQVGELLVKAKEPKAREVYGPPERTSFLSRVLFLLLGSAEEWDLVLKDRRHVGLYHLGTRRTGPVRAKVELLPEFRGQGLEEALLSRAISRSAGLGRKLVLQTEAERTKLVEAALRLGFQKAYVDESMVLFKGRKG